MVNAKAAMMRVKNVMLDSLECVSDRKWPIRGDTTVRSSDNSTSKCWGCRMSNTNKQISKVMNISKIIRVRILSW